MRKRGRDKKGGEAEAVKVAVRIRPLLGDHIRDEIAVTGDPSTCQVTACEEGEEPHQWTFDYVLPPNSTQEDMFHNVIEPMFPSVFEGFNATVFAYGQSGSGKTHTLLGSYDAPGIIPRFCRGLFELLEQKRHLLESDETLRSQVEVQYLEIYGEKVRDLLDPSKGKSGLKREHRDLKMREHPKTGPYVEGLQKITVQSPEEIEQLMAQGNKERVVATTLLNAVSSRSHAVFRITLQLSSLKSDGSGATHVNSSKLSTINLIDLAGSEKVKHSGAEGQALKEAAAINLSLSALGRVISELAAGKSEHVPYRLCKLTWLLKESLGGNAKTVMVAAINPTTPYILESLSTLRYAADCKKIINKAVVNEDANAKKIQDLQAEIQRLRNTLSTMGGEGSPDLGADQAFCIQEALQLNHAMMDKLQGIWVEDQEVQDRKSKIDQLEACMRQMEEEDGFDMNDEDYKLVQQELSDLREEEALQEESSSEKERALKDLEKEREAVNQKSQELEAVRAQYAQHKAEADDRLGTASDLIKLTKFRETNMKAVAEQRESILQKVVKQNEAQTDAMKEEIRLLESQLGDVTKQRDELLVFKNKRDATLGINRPSRGAGNRSHTPRTAREHRAGQMSFEEIRAALDRMPGAPRPGTRAHDWELRAQQKLKEKIAELQRAERLISEKDKEIVDLKENVRQHIQLRKRGRDEIIAAMDALRDTSNGPEGRRATVRRPDTGRIRSSSATVRRSHTPTSPPRERERVVTFRGGAFRPGGGNTTARSPPRTSFRSGRASQRSASHVPTSSTVVSETVIGSPSPPPLVGILSERSGGSTMRSRSQPLPGTTADGGSRRKGLLAWFRKKK